MSTSDSPKGFLRILHGTIRWLWIPLLLLGSFFFLNFDNGRIHEFGKIILISGILGGMLKSLQYSGVFKEELEKVIEGDKMKTVLSNELQIANENKLNKEDINAELSKVLFSLKHLEYRTDLDKIWKRVSQLIYNKKFPAIRKELEKIILKTYFPTEHDYYYKDLSIQINIESISDEMVIKYYEKWAFEVIMEDGVTEANIEYSVTNNKCQLHEIKTELKRITIDGQPGNFLSETELNEISTTEIFKISLTDKPRYKVELEFEKSDSLLESNYLLFRTYRFTEGMDVDVIFPEHVNVSFFNIGLIDKFEVCSAGANRIIRRHRGSLILPQQGAGLSFQRSHVNK